MAGQLPQKSGGRSRAPARSGMSTKQAHMMKLLQSDAMKGRLQDVMSEALKPERFIRIMNLAVYKNPKIAECTDASVMQAVLDAAALGYELGLDAHLVPYRAKGGDGQYRMTCNLIPDYRGLMRSARKSGKIADIWANVVREGDEFEQVEGLRRSLTHRPMKNQTGDEKLTHAYAVALFKDGTETFVVLPAWEVLRAKAASQSAKKKGGPWDKYEDRMWAKTAIRRLANFLPLAGEAAENMAMAIALDNQDYRGSAPRIVDQVPEPASASLPPSDGGDFDPDDGLVIDQDDDYGDDDYGDDGGVDSGEASDDEGGEEGRSEKDPHADLKAKAKKQKVTVPMLLQAAYAMEKGKFDGGLGGAKKKTLDRLNAMLDTEAGVVELEEWVSTWDGDA